MIELEDVNSLRSAKATTMLIRKGAGKKRCPIPLLEMFGCFAAPGKTKGNNRTVVIDPALSIVSGHATQARPHNTPKNNARSNSSEGYTSY